MSDIRTALKRASITAWVGTVVFFGVALLNLGMSNGDVIKQRLGSFLIFRIFFVLCGIDVVLFLAMLVMDTTTRPIRKINLWPYIIFAVVVMLFLLLPAIIIGSTWDFSRWF